MREYQSLAHTTWNCRYHVVFIPKKRKKAIFGGIRKHLGEVFHELARQKECQIVEGHLMRDHVHMCISIPPKHSVSHVVGYIKGKSAISIARNFMGRSRNFSGESFWARGYFVSTVGLDEGMVSACAQVFAHRASRKSNGYDECRCISSVQALKGLYPESGKGG